MPWGSVYTTCTCIKGDVGGEDDEALPFDKWVVGMEPLELTSPHSSKDLHVLLLKAHIPQHGVKPCLCYYPRLIPTPYHHIVIVRVEGYGQVCRKGPGSRSPYDDRELSPLHSTFQEL